jgi:hypothetical protein
MATNPSPRQPRPVAEWLEAEPNFRELALRSATLLRLQAELARVCGNLDLIVVRYEQGSLTVQARSPAVAAKLRQSGPTICSHMTKAGWNVAQLRVKPMQKPVVETPTRPIRAGLPASALTALDWLRSAVTDPDLRVSLTRMIARHRPASK